MGHRRVFTCLGFAYLMHMFLLIGSVSPAIAGNDSPQKLLLKSPAELFLEACKEKNTYKLRSAISLSGGLLVTWVMHNDNFERASYPLHIAAAHDFGEGVAVLLQSGASIHNIDPRGLTALDVAIQTNAQSALNVLLVNGASTGHVSANPIFLLLIAAFQNVIHMQGPAQYGAHGAGLST